ncbi:hypothetical protein C8J56DRAFT_1113265 [Mycena floridula]|nr:hypothetical protein C8J56DRAFT_1113265 [Mycena floridula]
MRRTLLAPFVVQLVKAIHLSVFSDPSPLGVGAVCLWAVSATDPIEFALKVGINEDKGPFVTVTRAAGQVQGSATSQALQTAGTHHLLALDINSGAVLSQLDFQVAEPAASDTSTSSPQSATTVVTESSSPTTTPTSAPDSTITSSPDQQPLSHTSSGTTSSPTANIGSNSASVKSQGSTDAPLPGTSSIQDSAANGTAGPLLSTTRRPNHTPIIAGTICAVIAVLALLIGALLLHRRRRKSYNTETTPYESVRPSGYDAVTVSDTSYYVAGTSESSTRFVSEKRKQAAASRPREPALSTAEKDPEPDPIERERILQSQRQQIERLLAQSDGVGSTSDSSASSSDFRAEIMRLKAAIQVLISAQGPHVVQQSGLVQGSADAPPPYLPSRSA